MTVPKKNETPAPSLLARELETDGLLNGFPSAQTSLLTFAAGAFTLIIFIIDAMTPLNIAIAVLYGAVILLASFSWPAQAIVILTCLCLILTLVAYGIGHRLDFFGPAFGRCVVSLAAIAITAFLALKGQASKNAILQAKEVLRTADRRKDEFLAMLAHELRNPLAPISSAAHYMQTATPSPENITEVSDIIIRQVNHLNGLVDDLLDVSRITRRIATLSKEKLNLEQIISDAVEQIHPLARDNDLRLKLDLPEEAVFVYGDHKRLVQVISNLLHNAVKYTQPGGAVVLRLQADEDQVIIEVRDTGAGILPEWLPHIFEWFVQADRGLNRMEGGLGIGLALAKSLVELHDGQIRGTSAGVGKGSQFTILLPRMKIQTAPKEPAQAPPDAPDVNRLRILVVDDNVQAAKMLTLYLTALGHDVFDETGSLSGLERARRERPDVCLLDIGLPEMDGNELAQRLRNDARTHNALLIAISGYGQERDKKKAMEAGFDHYLIKPVDTGKLNALLADTVQARKASMTRRDEALI